MSSGEAGRDRMTTVPGVSSSSVTFTLDDFLDTKCSISFISSCSFAVTTMTDDDALFLTLSSSSSQFDGSLAGAS